MRWRPSSSSCVPSRERLPDPHHDAAVDLAVGPGPVEDAPAVVHGGDPEHADDAGLAVDADVCRVRDQLRRVERLEPQTADASLGRRGGRLGNRSRALPWNVAPAASVRDRHRLLGRTLDPDGAADELQVAARGLERLGCRVEQLLAHLDRGREHGARRC